MGSVKCILLSTGLKIGSCEGREELQPGVRGLLREPQPTAEIHSKLQCLAGCFVESCLGLALPIGKIFPAECQSPAGRRAGAVVLTLPFPVPESLTQKSIDLNLQTTQTVIYNGKYQETPRGLVAIP